MQDIREREYKYLTGRLRSLNLTLERGLFIAVLNTLTNIESFGYPKLAAVKMASKQQGVSQVEIKRVLDDINYMTPTQVQRRYGGFSQDAQKLKRILEMK